MRTLVFASVLMVSCAAPIASSPVDGSIPEGNRSGNGNGNGHGHHDRHHHDEDDSEAPSPTVTPTPTGGVTSEVSNVSTLSGAEALAAQASCRLFAKSLQDPAGSPVQFGLVASGVATMLSTQASVRNSDISGITIDPMSRQLLVADEVGRRIAKIDPATHAVTTVFTLPWILNPASNGTGQQQYAPDPDTAILYFWDSTQSAIFRLDRLNGALSTVFSIDQVTPAGQHLLTYTNDLVFDPRTGTILLADNASGSVLEIDPRTSPPNVTTLFPGVLMPHALALSPDGTNVYVGSSFHSILVGARAGGSLSLLAGGFPFMTDLVACGDSVYAADKSLDTIFRIRPAYASPCDDDDDDDDDD